MFAELQRHRHGQLMRRGYLLLESWNTLARRAAADRRLIAFFGSSNLFWPYSMDRQLAELLARRGASANVLNLGSYGFGDSTHVVATTLAMIEAWRRQPIELLVFEVTANEMPPLDKDMARSFARRSSKDRLVLDHEEAAPIAARLQGAQIPLRDNLARLAAIAREAPRPFPVLLLDYEANLRDWPPSVSFFSRPVDGRDAEQYRVQLREAIASFRRGDMAATAHALECCAAIDGEVAIASYLTAKLADAAGDRPAAAAHYRRARNLDLIRGRLSPDQLLQDLREMAASLGFGFVSAADVVRQCVGHELHGFDAFVDDVHYRPHVHFALARALADWLATNGLAPPASTPVATDVVPGGLPAEVPEDVIRAVDGQRQYTHLQCALNLVLVPPSPYNDERVSEGWRNVEAAARMGADPRLVELYRLRFSLLAGLEDTTRDLLERRDARVIDPLALLFNYGVTARTQQPRPGAADADGGEETPGVDGGEEIDRALAHARGDAAPAAASMARGRKRSAERLTADEIGGSLEDLLLSRFGLQITADVMETDLLQLGVDSLGLAELLMTLGGMFDVILTDRVFDRELTFVSLRDLVAARLVEPPARRLAYESSVARQRALANRPPRRVGALRLRDAAMTATPLAEWERLTIAEVLEQHFVGRPDWPAITLLAARDRPASDDGGNADTAAASVSAADARTADASTVDTVAGMIDLVRWNWRDLDRASAALAAFLTAQGLVSGARVHFLTGHGPITVAGVVAALRMGLVPSIGQSPSPKLSPAVFAEAFGELVRRSEPAAIIVPPELDALVRASLRDARLDEPGPLVIRVTGDVLSSPARSHDDARESGDAHHEVRHRAGGTPDRIALLQHSSGTTGARKAVALTDATLMRQISHYAHAIDLRDDDCIVSWLPLYHDMGLVACFLLPLLTATPLTLMSPFDWVASPHRLLDAIARERGSLVWLPNFAFHFLAERVRPEQLDGLDLSSLRAVINCSEPIDLESWRRFYDRFAFHGLSRFAFGTCYAMAENVFAATQGGIGQPLFVDLIDAARLRREGLAVPRDPRRDDDEAEGAILAVPTSGRAIGGCRVRIVSDDDAREPLPDRRVGEIEVSGSSLTSGYFNNADATEAAFKGEWYRSGDIGYMVDGDLFVLGRGTDVIIVAGVNVFADDIERVVSSVAGLKPGRAAAFGVRDARRGTARVVVLAEAVDGAPLDAEAQRLLRLAVQQRLSDTLQIGACDLRIVPAGVIRKTSSGKVARRRMRELFEAGELVSAVPA